MPKIKKNLVLLFTFVLLFTSVQTVAYGEEDLGSWETKASMTFARQSLGAAEVNGKIYAIGGSKKLDAVEEYDPETNTWTTKASMSIPRACLGVIETNGKIYVMGGYTTDGKALDAVEEYDPETDTWTTKASMLYPTYSFGAVEFNGKIYTIGGVAFDGNTSQQNIVQEYDPITDTWTEKANMPTGRYDLAVAQTNGKIYAIGSDKSRKIVEEYDPETDTWTTKASTLMPRSFTRAIGCNGKIYVIGGSNGGITNISKNVEIYDPATDTWTLAEEMITGRIRVALAILNGKIYAIGGSGSEGITNIVESYTLPQTSTPAPLNLTATGGDSKVTLNWNEVADCDSYKIYRSTTSGEPYDLISSSVTTSSYVDFDVTNGTTYYYVVTAVKSGVESEYSNEASATPQGQEQPTGDRALLVITMQNGLEKEYDMSMTEVEEFIDWYNSDNASPSYTIDKDYNVDPFTSRKDYIAHDKIMCFEVNEYEE